MRGEGYRTEKKNNKKGKSKKNSYYTYNPEKKKQNRTDI